MSNRPTDRLTDRLADRVRKKVCLIFLKLGTLKVHDKSIWAIFEFWWDSFFMGMKFNLKFEIWENFYKGFPCKKKNPCEFSVKWTQIKFKRNSYVKLLLKVRYNFYMRIHCKMNPDQIWKEFSYKITAGGPMDLKLAEFHLSS